MIMNTDRGLIITLLLFFALASGCGSKRVLTQSPTAGMVAGSSGEIRPLTTVSSPEAAATDGSPKQHAEEVSEPAGSEASGDEDEFPELEPEEEETVTIADPLEPINRVVFQFNDTRHKKARRYAGLWTF